MRRAAAAVLAAVLSLFGVVAITAATAAPANAEIRACQTAKNSPCVGPVNGCTVTIGGGKYLFLEDGDTILDNFGHRLTCKHGNWVTTPARQEVASGPVLGGGRLDIKPYDPIVVPPPCDPNTVGCP